LPLNWWEVVFKLAASGVEVILPIRNVVPKRRR
jgi:hypothetical protein